MPTPLDADSIRRAPKVLLHDHLDGGLRPRRSSTSRRRIGYDALPTTDVAELARWFRESADSGSLERYLETFTHTVAVMQTVGGLSRVARECVEDLAADGVVYAEVRWAPEQHVAEGLTLEQVVEAVLSGFREGEAIAAAAGRSIRVGAIVTAMRHAARSKEIAELAVQYRDDGVVGFDIAGAEAGFPPSRHLDAFEYLRRENFHFTIHAGEAFGLPSIWEAIQWCGTDRSGPRRADRRRHHRRRPARPARAVRSRQAHPAGDVPVVQRPDRRREVDRRAPHRAAAPAAVPGHGEHRQPVDERRRR